MMPPVSDRKFIEESKWVVITLPVFRRFVIVLGLLVFGNRSRTLSGDGCCYSLILIIRGRNMIPCVLAPYISICSEISSYVLDRIKSREKLHIHT